MTGPTLVPTPLSAENPILLNLMARCQAQCVRSPSGLFIFPVYETFLLQDPLTNQRTTPAKTHRRP
jgi:hypothetical protein